jgi:hypothetical protein
MNVNNNMNGGKSIFGNLEFNFKNIIDLEDPNNSKLNFSIINDDMVYGYNPKRYNFYMQFIEALNNPEILKKVLYANTNIKNTKKIEESNITDIVDGLKTLYAYKREPNISDQDYLKKQNDRKTAINNEIVNRIRTIVDDNIDKFKTKDKIDENIKKTFIGGVIDEKDKKKFVKDFIKKKYNPNDDIKVVIKDDSEYTDKNKYEITNIGDKIICSEEISNLNIITIYHYKIKKDIETIVNNLNNILDKIKNKKNVNTIPINDIKQDIIKQNISINTDFIKEEPKVIKEYEKIIEVQEKIVEVEKKIQEQPNNVKYKKEYDELLKKYNNLNDKYNELLNKKPEIKKVIKVITEIKELEKEKQLVSNPDIIIKKQDEIIEKHKDDLIEYYKYFNIKDNSTKPLRDYSNEFDIILDKKNEDKKFFGGKIDKIININKEKNQKLLNKITELNNNRITPLENFVNKLDVIINNKVKTDISNNNKDGKIIGGKEFTSILSDSQYQQMNDLVYKIENDPLLSIKNLEITNEDRLIFIAITFLIRIITLAFIEWGMNTNFIISFEQCFIAYCIIYIVIFCLISIIVNIIYNYPLTQLFADDNSLVNLPSMLYYFYIYTNGPMRLILHISLILILMIVPFIIKQSTDKKDVSFDYETKRKTKKILNNFSLVIWILTSIISIKY